MVDVERDDGCIVGRGGREAGDAMIFLLVEGGDVERVFVELGVSHYCELGIGR